jgi:hypothetical protein
MIKHIVFWKLNSSFDAAAKTTNAIEVKQRLEALAGTIPELITIEVGINFNATDGAADLVLYTEFASREDLDRYQQHPRHVALIPFVFSITEERRVVDYEV